MLGCVSGLRNYNFKAARERQCELVALYRQGRKVNSDDQEWGWDLIAQIEEIEREIAEAHQSSNAKMATARNSNHPVMQLNNLVMPIVPHWHGNRQEGVLTH